MTNKIVSKDIPLAEITLRKYEKPYKTSKRDTVKKLCLSIGLLQPGDSRDIITDIFHSLIESKKALTSEEIKEKVISLRKKAKLPLKGVASSNIRRQLKRLRDLYLVEKVKNNYRITENDTLENIFNEKIKKFHVESILDRVNEYFKAIK